MPLRGSVLVDDGLRVGFHLAMCKHVVCSFEQRGVGGHGSISALASQSSVAGGTVAEYAGMCITLN